MVVADFKRKHMYINFNTINFIWGIMASHVIRIIIIWTSETQTQSSPKLNRAYTVGTK